MEVIVKKFEPHYNRALGKPITSQRQYKEEMKKGNYISYDECKERVTNFHEKKERVKYENMGRVAQEITREAFNLTKQGRGDERPGSRMIDAYKEIKRRK